MAAYLPPYLPTIFLKSFDSIPTRDIAEDTHTETNTWEEGV